MRTTTATTLGQHHSSTESCAELCSPTTTGIESATRTWILFIVFSGLNTSNLFVFAHLQTRRCSEWSSDPGTSLERSERPQTIGTPECTNPLEEARVFRRLYSKQASSVSQFILATSKSRFDLHWRKGFYCSSAPDSICVCQSPPWPMASPNPSFQPICLPNLNYVRVHCPICPSSVLIDEAHKV